MKLFFLEMDNIKYLKQSHRNKHKNANIKVESDFRNLCLGAVTLTTNPSVHAPCNGSLSLACSVTTLEQPSRMEMSWVSMDGVLCKLADGVISDQAENIQCRYDSERQTLTLLLLDARPSDHKTYHCKMLSNLGIGHTNTIVLPTGELSSRIPHVRVILWVEKKQWWF